MCLNFLIKIKAMNIGKLNQKLEKFLEDFVSVNYEDLPDMRSLLDEFFEDKSKGVPYYQWKLIPKQQYHNALKMYMRDGKDFKFPKRILEDWLNLILYNVTILDIMTELAGHTSYFDYYTLNDIFYEDNVVIVDYDSAYEVLEKEGFYDWAVLPDGTDAISDYGRKPIYDILSNLPDFPSSEQMIIAINRCLDVVHCRGDLASAFIEGGAKSCYQISNENINEESALYKSNQPIFRDFYNYVIKNPKAKKSYFALYSGRLRIPSDTILHDYKKHNMTMEHWDDAISNILNIQNASISNKKLSNNPMLLMRLLGFKDYGISLMYCKDYFQITTCFHDKQDQIDNWIKVSSARSMANNPPSSLGNNPESVVLPGQQLNIIIQQLKKYVKSDLNEEQLKLPFEGNFKAWFKDSKCVDENGNPLVVYHGTKNKFTKFSKDKIGSKTDYGYAGKGFYFHIDKDTAKVYGDNVMACYLSVQNPFDFNNGKSINDNIRDMGIDSEIDNHWEPIEVREERVSGKITQWLKENGYDGAKLWGQWMVLEPWQIKSIDNKEPTYSDDINEKLEKVKGVEYLYNPTKSELQGLLNKSKNEVRGILMVDTDELYIWNAYEYTHSYIDSLLGLKGFRIEFRIEDNWLIGNGPDGLLCREFLEILSQSRVMELGIELFDPVGYLQ